MSLDGDDFKPTDSSERRFSGKPASNYNQHHQHQQRESTFNNNLSQETKDELIYCKVFYFCYSSAMGSLWPYFPLYFRQQFLTPRQVGSIVASRTLLQFLFVPFWCAIAEKFKRHKQILLVGLFAWLISTLAIKMVPREEPKACHQMSKQASLKKDKHINKDPVWFDFSPFLNPESSSSSLSSKSIPNDSAEKNVIEDAQQRQRRDVKDDTQQQRQQRDVKDDTQQQRQRRDHDGIYDDYYSPATMFNTTRDFETIYEEYDPAKHITDSSQAFILLMIITTVGVSLASPSQTLVDICTMKQLRHSEETFGKQVVWAAIGSALFAFLVGTFVSFFRIKNPCTMEEDIDYAFCFYAFAFFMSVTILVSTRFKFYKNDLSSSISEAVHIDLDESIANLWECMKTINDIHLASLLIVTFYCGFGNGFISTFLFWHLQEMGGLQILLALVSLINSTAEVLFYVVSERLMQCIGHFRLIYIGLLCFSVRFFYYSFLRQPWLVLPIEITHGMTSAAIRSALISYIRQEGSVGHLLHGLINGIHGGLGFSIGGLVGGFMVHNYGHVLTFLIFGELSLLTLFLFILVNNVWPHTKHDLKDDKEDELLLEHSFSKMTTTTKFSTKLNTTFGNMFFANETVDHSFRNISLILSSTVRDGE